jgi:TRAP-type C4-dicarboxylate transport system substrate-binding protein
MRTTASALHQEIFASFGFVPMAIDPADLPAAVAEQRVDAQENPLTNFVNFGIHRHHKHVTLSSHFFGCAPLLINRARYDALAPAAREALHDAAAQATAAQRGFALGEDSECRRLIVAEGARIVETADVDVAAFRAASAALVKRETEVIGRDVMAMLEVLRG